jgi:hypothetical protein
VLPGCLADHIDAKQTFEPSPEMVNEALRDSALTDFDSRLPSSQINEAPPRQQSGRA